MRGLLGVVVILAFAWVLSEDRFRVPWRLVFCGVALQFALALLLLKFPPAAAVFLLLTGAVEAVQKATEAGTGFVFGYLGGGELPFSESKPGAAYIFAFRALPMVLVVSAPRRCCSTGASCSASCRHSPGSCADRSGLAAPLGSAPRCTFLSGISRRRF